MPGAAPHPVPAFLLTLLAPGLGHLYAGWRQRGARAAAAAFFLLLTALGLSVLPPANLPTLLLMALPGGLLPVFVLLAALDAARKAMQSNATDGSARLFLVGAIVWPVVLMTFAGLIYAVTNIRLLVAASDDMAPTLLAGDGVVVWRDYYRGRQPVRGDIAVLRLPGETEDRIMRIVGLPGDNLLSVVGVLSVNGRLAERDRLDDFAWHSTAGKYRVAWLWRETLPDGPSYEVLQSAGSKPGGPGPGASPRVPDGTYFVIGDNRDDSGSSWDFGFIPGGAIGGRPTVIVGSTVRSRIGRSVQP